MRRLRIRLARLIFPKNATVADVFGRTPTVRFTMDPEYVARIIREVEGR